MFLPTSPPHFLSFQAVRGPMPFLKIVPTTGVTEENCQEYMGAGVFGVSFTAVLFNPEDMQHKRFDRIEVCA